jgi:hypothetical protein
MNDLKLEFITQRKADEYNGLNIPFIKVEERGFYLTLSACNKYDINAGMHLHIAKGRNERGVITGWYMVVNTDPKDGYKVSASNHGACICLSRPLSRLFRMETRSNVGDGFYLHDTGSEANGSPVIEIKTNKTVKAIKAGN